MALTQLIRNTLLLCAVTVCVGCDTKTAAEHFADAQAAVAEGQPNVAIIELKNAIGKEPQNANALALLGQLRLQQGDVSAANKDLKRAVDLGVEDDVTTLAYLRTKNALGDHTAVVGELEEQTQLPPEYAIVLAEAYLRANDVEGAKLQFQKGLHLAEGLLGMARVAFLENDSQRALSYVDQAVEKAPEYRDAWLFKGEVELSLQQTEAALSAFTRASELPGSPAGPHLGIVRAHMAAGDLDAANKAADRLINVSPKFPHAHYLKALIAFRQQDFSVAQSALETVSKLTGDDPQAMRLMAAVKYEMGDRDASERLLRRYMKLDSADASVRKLLARIVAESGRPEEVVKLLQPIAAQEADPQVWAMLGDAYMRTGEKGSATEAYESAVQIAPDMAPFRNQLALSLLSAGDSERALAQLTSAVELGEGALESEYLLVLVKIKDGDFASATEIASRLVARDPENPVGHHLQGVIAVEQGRGEAAQAAFTEALRHDPAYFPSANSLAQLALENGAVGDARAHYERLAQLDGGHVRANLALAELDISERNFDQATARLTATTEQFPESVPAHTALARMLMATGRLNDAQQSVSRALELGGESRDLLFLQAEIHLRSGNQENARKSADKLQAQADRFENNAALLNALGSLQLRVGSYTAARQNLLRALQIEGEHQSAVLVNLVRLELADENPNSAQRYLDQLVKADSVGEEIALLQGEVHLAANRTDAALQQFQSMSSQGSRDATVKAAVILLQEERYVEADQLLRAWQEEHPSDMGIDNLLATARVQLGDTQAAKAQYEAMMPTNNVVTLNNLAWIYHLEGDRRALQLARKANEVAPDNPDVQDTLGWILVNNDRAEEALPLLQASARARPNQGAVQYHLGIAYLALGESAKATEALQKALDLGGFDEVADAQQALRELLQS